MRGRRGFIVGTVFFLFVSCAVITVNIYFPEKDVKEAYKALEKELMTTEPKTNGQLPEPKPQAGPESSIRFEFVTAAYAQEAGLPEKIAAIVKKMPEVANAYREMGGRAAETERLRDSGAVGEGRDGMLVARGDTLPPSDKKLIEMENENRRTVITGMTKAIIRINRQPETSDNIKQVMPQAAEQFAALRRDTAKKGWWIQDPAGNWSKK